MQDLVSLTDLAPTFLEVAGITIPDAMTGRSLLPILKSQESGQLDPKRSHVLTGMDMPSSLRACDGNSTLPLANPTIRDLWRSRKNPESDAVRTPYENPKR